ncbi:ABC transporter ATP-binding protein [Gammaproteobacteria bacterium]|nr:ABC transporter ATP-binding protein [Gammaproteobacteria bacterium]
MIQIIFQLYSVLTKQQKLKLFQLQFLVILMAFGELVGVASIGPFLSLVSNPDQLDGNNFFAYLFSFLSLTNPDDFIFLAGLGVIMLLTSATIISSITVRFLLHYAQRLGATFSSSLYEHYMNQPWLFHASGNSNKLMNNITTECARVTQGIIYPVMIMNAKVALAACIIIFLILMNPLVTIAGFFIFSIIYSLIFLFVKKKLAINGLAITTTQRERFQLMNEGFGGIKDVILLDRSSTFTNAYTSASIEYGRANGGNATMNEVPKFWVELIAFGAMISLILFLLATNNGSLNVILPQLGIYAMASYKLLPAFQQVYGNLTFVRGSASALNSIRSDLLEWRSAKENPTDDIHRKISFKEHIEFKNVSFKYPSKNELALENINLKIHAKSIVGLVGSSGAGKSTIVDLILGLLVPSNGSVLVDGSPLYNSSLKAWQSCVGYVPQTIFLSDNTIAANVALGLQEESIDVVKVRNAIKLADLDSFVNSLPNGLNEMVGERGVQLSGGQKQRIAIARALYNDPSILVFDEATSALDGITEKVIMDAIYKLSSSKTIILIAHRLNTVKQCDEIFFFEGGRLIDSGSFDTMKTNNKKFKQMSDHS